MSGYRTLAGNSLVPACGYCVRVRSGGFCRQRMVNGTASSNVFHAGAPMAYGRNSMVIFLKRLICKMFLWMARSLGHMPARLGRRTAALRMKHWDVPKVGLVVRCTRFVMPGMPIKFILTGGQGAECKQAIPLLENVKALAVLADKGYDTNELREWLKGQGIKAVIPPKSNRKEAIECDYRRYKERHAVECMFGKLKHYRRIAMRYEKKAINYMGMLSFSSSLLWLR
jgi:transposase